MGYSSVEIHFVIVVVELVRAVLVGNKGRLHDVP